MPTEPSILAPKKISKLMLYASLSIMLVTGLAWLILNNWFQQNTAVGLQKHPWQKNLLAIHGIGSYLFSVIFGCLISQHVVPAWKAKKYRTSGKVLLGLISFMILSGAAFLFLPLSDRLDSILGWIHAGSGLLLLTVLIIHIGVVSKIRQVLKDFLALF